MLLAGDVGGTKTLLGLFEHAPGRPRPIVVDEFVTLDHDGLEAIVDRFLSARGTAQRDLRAATFGVAGAITDQVAHLTNVPWLVKASSLKAALEVDHVNILNDLEALAYAVPVLAEDEIAVLQEGVRIASGNIGIIAAGTGLGESMLLNIGGRFHPGESEGGHADFAARTPRELEMVAVLTRRFGRVELEHVLSGPGLINVYQFTHDAFGSAPYSQPTTTMPSKLCPGVGDLADPSELPARITASAMARRCPTCVETLEIFVSAYGAAAGNLALRTVATAGVFVGGGIAPRIVPALRAGGFMSAFRDKTPMDQLVARIPVRVILNPRTGLLGAAVHADSVPRD
jgi:glucokinase